MESPEIRDRARRCLTEIRKDQLWDAFARVAGDDKVARELFTISPSSPRAIGLSRPLSTIPLRTDELYRTRTAELLRIAGPAIRRSMLKGKRACRPAVDVRAVPML